MRKLFIFLISIIFLFISCNQNEELTDICLSVDLDCSNKCLFAELNTPFTVHYQYVKDNSVKVTQDFEIAFTDDTLFELESIDYENQCFIVKPINTGTGKVRLITDYCYFSTLPIYIN